MSGVSLVDYNGGFHLNRDGTFTAKTITPEGLVREDSEGFPCWSIRGTEFNDLELVAGNDKAIYRNFNQRWELETVNAGGGWPAAIDEYSTLPSDPNPAGWFGCRSMLGFAFNLNQDKLPHWVEVQFFDSNLPTAPFLCKVVDQAQSTTFTWRTTISAPCFPGGPVLAGFTVEYGPIAPRRRFAIFAGQEFTTNTVTFEIDTVDTNDPIVDACYIDLTIPCTDTNGPHACATVGVSSARVRGIWNW